MYIVKVPGINGLGKTNGCEKAGNAIINILKEIYTNENGKEIKANELDLEEIHVNNSNIEEANELIYKNAFETFEEKPKTVFLGGDHSVSYSLARAFFDSCENSGRETCLIVFDAHADCMEPMRVESKDSSHTTLTHCKEPTHEEWLSTLIEKQIKDFHSSAEGAERDGFPAKNILLVGVRNIWKTEAEFLKKHKIRVITMNQLLDNLQDTCDIIMEFSKNKELYVSIDIDVIDPVFAPSVCYKEPGGLTSRQFIYIIQRMNKMKNLRAVDIVEVNSEKDKDNLTVKLAAKILSELL